MPGLSCCFLRLSQCPYYSLVLLPGLPKVKVVLILVLPVLGIIADLLFRVEYLILQLRVTNSGLGLHGIVLGVDALAGQGGDADL